MQGVVYVGGSSCRKVVHVGVVHVGGSSCKG